MAPPPIRKKTIFSDSDSEDVLSERPKSPHPPPPRTKAAMKDFSVDELSRATKKAAAEKADNKTSRKDKKKPEPKTATRPRPFDDSSDGLSSEAAESEPEPPPPPTKKTGKGEQRQQHLENDPPYVLANF